MASTGNINGTNQAPDLDEFGRTGYGGGQNGEIALPSRFAGLWRSPARRGAGPASNPENAFEIKATSAPKPDDARHLLWLRDEYGQWFVGGAVLHTGPRAFMLAERIAAAPITTLWR